MINDIDQYINCIRSLKDIFKKSKDTVLLEYLKEM